MDTHVVAVIERLIFTGVSWNPVVRTAYGGTAPTVSHANANPVIKFKIAHGDTFTAGGKMRSQSSLVGSGTAAPSTLDTHPEVSSAARINTAALLIPSPPRFQGQT